MTKHLAAKITYGKYMRVCRNLYRRWKGAPIGNEVYGRHFRTIKRDSTLYK